MTTTALTVVQAELLSEQLRTAGLPAGRTFALHLIVTGGRAPALFPWLMPYQVGSPVSVVSWLAERAADGDLALPTVQQPAAVDVPDPEPMPWPS